MVASFIHGDTQEILQSSRSYPFGVFAPRKLRLCSWYWFYHYFSTFSLSVFEVLLLYWVCLAGVSSTWNCLIQGQSWRWLCFCTWLLNFRETLTVLPVQLLHRTTKLKSQHLCRLKLISLHLLFLCLKPYLSSSLVNGVVMQRPGLLFHRSVRRPCNLWLTICLNTKFLLIP